MVDRVVVGAEASTPGPTRMDDARSPFFERAMGFYDERLRSKIINASARIAGVGGGGLTLAVMLAKEGVRDFSVADVEEVEATNVGRIPMLTPADIGTHKADVAARLIVEHNPTASVRVYRSGVSEDTVDEFLANFGSASPVIAFDEIEITRPEIALLLHRRARQHDVHVIAATDVERGGLVTTFRPDDMEHTFEHYNGASPTDSIEEFRRQVSGFQLPMIPNIPITGSISTLRAAASGASLPTTLQSVLIATSLALDEFERLLTLDDPRYKQPHFYPRVHCANPSAGEDFVTKHVRTRSTTRILRMILRDLARRNPPASYSQTQRGARRRWQEEAG